MDERAATNEAAAARRRNIGMMNDHAASNRPETGWSVNGR
jgi:hypothetical protein